MFTGNSSTSIRGIVRGNIDLDRYGKHYDAEILYENCTKRIVYESSREAED